MIKKVASQSVTPFLLLPSEAGLCANGISSYITRHIAFHKGKPSHEL
jgi:hypothetical protein